VKPMLFWSIGVFIPKMWMKLGIYLNGWLVILISLSKLVVPLRCLSLIRVLSIQDRVMRIDLCNLVPFPLNPLNMLPLFATWVNHSTMTPTLVLML